MVELLPRPTDSGGTATTWGAPAHPRLQPQPHTPSTWHSSESFSLGASAADSMPPLGVSPLEGCPPPAIPATDGVIFLLGTLTYEAFLYKRMYSQLRQATPWEVLVLGLGVGHCLAALAWWNTPGTAYLRYRRWLFFSMRLHHILTVYTIPCSAVFSANSPQPWADFIYMVLAPGWLVFTLFLTVLFPLPLLHSILLIALMTPLVPFKACQCCALPFMEPLEGRIAATLRLLSGSSLLGLLRGGNSVPSAEESCQLVLGALYGVVSLALPLCLALEAWVTKHPHEASHTSQPGFAQGGRRGQPTPRAAYQRFSRSLSMRVAPPQLLTHLPPSARLAVYFMTVQLTKAAVLGGFSLVMWAKAMDGGGVCEVTRGG